MARARSRLLSVIGGRPEIIQAAPLTRALAPLVDEILVHTGQHYDEAMSGGQILATELPVPAYNLGVGSRPDAEQLALGEERLAALIDELRPDAVLVRGDTNATLAGARAAVSRELPLLHVEAGLRSFRDDMPEERNRVQTDRVSDVLFAPTETGRANLEAEGIRGEVHVTGDVMCDMLLAWEPRVQRAAADAEYVLATVHRNYNTDDPKRLAAVFECLGAAPCDVVFPVHPRTRARIDATGLKPPANVSLIEPVSYTRMLELERGARAIATDSGGVQREAYVWGVPCVTLREETEWVETVQTGWNTLVGIDRDAFAEALARPQPGERPPVFGDGKAAPRIAGLTAEFLAGGSAEEAAHG
jgi:UDP-N-acetylglucosamine 2-epimerase